ncbi:hypothetical protein F4604DRAFT_1583223 [Suillus subluteus]|nr:hypothetical protein F4604DRAFT_1583223 [Suillus subluteus]
MLVDLDVDIEHLPYTAPPGEEGADLSHEGREYEAFEGLFYMNVLMYVSHYVDPCIHRDHIDVQTTNWNLQMEHLVSAHLDYCTWDCGDGMSYISR